MRNAKKDAQTKKQDVIAYANQSQFRLMKDTLKHR
jgi:hypothetical protein